MKRIPEPCPEFADDDVPDATDLATAIALANKLKGFLLTNELSVISRVNDVIEVIDDEN